MSILDKGIGPDCERWAAKQNAGKSTVGLESYETAAKGPFIPMSLVKMKGALKAKIQGQAGTSGQAVVFTIGW